MNNSDNSKKLWDGRFTEATDAFVESFTASVSFDQVLALYDIEGSIAHATMLCRVGVLNDNELGQITGGLEQIAQQVCNVSVPLGRLCPLDYKP